MMTTAAPEQVESGPATVYTTVVVVQTVYV